MKKTNSWISFGGGLAGAVALTAIHQYTKSRDQNAPRMDLLGMEALAKALHKAKAEVPNANTLYNLTMAGDILSNAVYYSAAGLGPKRTLLKGTLLGLAAGIGAVYLPKPMGLDEQHSARTAETKLLAVSYYLAGGLVAAFGIKTLKRITKRKTL